jgi:hypothetical protein
MTATFLLVALFIAIVFLLLTTQISRRSSQPPGERTAIVIQPTPNPRPQPTQSRTSSAGCQGVLQMVAILAILIVGLVLLVFYCSQAGCL